MTRDMMFMLTKAVRTACAVAIGFTASLAANAAAVPPPPPAPAPPKSKPYQPVTQNDVTGAYEYRTRILSGNPACQRYATESDAAFLDDKLDDKVKAARLKRIGAEAAAAGCISP